MDFSQFPDFNTDGFIPTYKPFFEGEQEIIEGISNIDLFNIFCIVMIHTSIENNVFERYKNVSYILRMAKQGITMEKSIFQSAIPLIQIAFTAYKNDSNLLSETPLEILYLLKRYFNGEFEKSTQ